MLAFLADGLKYWASGGNLLIAIAAVCFAMWLVLFRLHARYRRALEAPEVIEDQVLTVLQRGHNCAELKQLAARTKAPFSHILQYLAEREAQGMNLLQAFREAKEEELEPFEREMTVLQALVAAAPLLGLLGTVFGMIGTFDAISLQVRETTGLMSSGISQALITTQFGLIVALPGMLGMSALRRKHKQLGVRLSALQQHVILGFQKRERAAA